VRKEIGRVFIVFSAPVLEWRHGICDHFVTLFFHEGAFLFHLYKRPLVKLAFLAKPEIRLEQN